MALYLGTCFGWQNQLLVNGDANGCVVSPGEIHLPSSAVRRRDDGHRVISGRTKLFTRGVVRWVRLLTRTCFGLGHLFPPHLLGTYPLARDGRRLCDEKMRVGWSCVVIMPGHLSCCISQEWVQLARGYQPARATVAASALPHREHIDNYVYIELICNRHPHATRDLR